MWLCPRELGLHQRHFQGKHHRTTRHHTKTPFAASLNEEEVKHFFEVELDVHHGTVLRLAKEGIERTDHLVGFTSTNVKTIIGNLRWPGGTVPEEAI